MSSQSNRAYLRGIKAKIAEVPKVAAIEIGVRIFIGMVSQTVIDSGQAALNWRLQPFTGSVSYAPQQVLWGYGDISPVTPAGYKWSKGANEGVRMSVVEGAFAIAAGLRTAKFDGISIYNPIQPGFAAFHPGNDAHYFENALGEAEARMQGVISEATEEGEYAVAQEFDFVRVI